MYPSYSSLSDRHEREKNLIRQLELERKISKIQSGAYSIADWNGTSFVSLTPSVKSFGSQTISSTNVPTNVSTNVPTLGVETANLYKEISLAEKNRGTSPLSVVSAPTTKTENIRLGIRPNLIDELKSKLGTTNLGLNKVRRPAPTSMKSEIPITNNSETKPQTPDQWEAWVKKTLNGSQETIDALSTMGNKLPIAHINSKKQHTNFFNAKGAIMQEITKKDDSTFIKSSNFSPNNINWEKTGELLWNAINRVRTGQSEARSALEPIISPEQAQSELKGFLTPENKIVIGDVNMSPIMNGKTIDWVATHNEVRKRERSESGSSPPNSGNPADRKLTRDELSQDITQAGMGFSKPKKSRFHNLTFKTIGARKVHLASLQKGYLSVRHMNGTMAGRKTKIDNQLLRLIKTFVFDDHIDQPLYDALDVDDQTIFSELLRASRIQNTLKDGWKSPKESLKAKYDTLVGELNIGNDSVIPELKKILVDMYSQGMIGDKEFKKLLEHVL
jgi:hypothetical protein